MSEVVYVRRPGFHVRGDMQAIGERIEALKKRNATEEVPDGAVTDEEVLEDARDPASPFHLDFTWDRDEAARLRNLEEARYLIRCYEVHIIKPDTDPVVICPANVVIETPNGRQYTSTAYAISQPETRDQVIREATVLLAGARKRLESIQGINPKVFTLLARLLTMLGDAATRKQKPARA